MRVVIFGAGAIGSYVGGLLAKQHNVTFIGRHAHMQSIRKNGLKIQGKTELDLDPKTIRALEGIEQLKKGCGPPELMLITVKSYDTQAIIPDIKKIIDNNTILLTLQNGLENGELLRKKFKNNVVLGCTICHGVTYLGPGKIYHAGYGDTMVGSFDPENEKYANEVNKIFTEAGLENQLTDNICGEIWTKVAINASINPITAITGLKNGWLLQEQKLRSLLENTCNEVISVAHRSGAKLPEGPRGDILNRTIRVVERTADNKSSMLQDIEKGRKTEIDSINGAVVRVGDRNNIPTPINSTLTTLVKGLEKQALKNS